MKDKCSKSRTRACRGITSQRFPRLRITHESWSWKMGPSPPMLDPHPPPHRRLALLPSSSAPAAHDRCSGRRPSPRAARRWTELLEEDRGGTRNTRVTAQPEQKSARTGGAPVIRRPEETRPPHGSAVRVAVTPHGRASRRFQVKHNRPELGCSRIKILVVYLW